MEQKNLWVKSFKKEIKNKTHYAKIQTREESETGEQFIDLIIGKKGEERKKGGMHLGLNLTQTLHFIEPRRITHKIEREVISKLYGNLGKEEAYYNEFKKVMRKVRIQFQMDGPTGEVRLIKFQFLE